MKNKKQQKNTLSPLAEMVQKNLDVRKWDWKKLEKESGVNYSTIRRFLNGSKQIEVESVYKILITLNLLLISAERIFIQLPISGLEKELYFKMEEILKNNRDGTKKLFKNIIDIFHNQYQIEQLKIESHLTKANS